MSGSNSSSPAAAADSPQSEPGRDEPLGLTVHSLPSAMAVAPETRAGRWKLMLLFLISAAPVIASYFTYYVIRPDGRRNYGELIDPQRPLPDVRAVGLEGEPRRLPELKHQWLLVSVGASSCNERCEKNLYLSRQLREALGKDKDRLDWVWLRTDDAPVPQALHPALVSATVLQLDAADIASWLQPASGQQLSDHLYVVDPMGHWMMRFPADLDGRKALKDLERLMRGSASWDQAGRS